MKDMLQDKEIVTDTYDMLMKSDMGKAFPDIARTLVRRNICEGAESGDHDGTTTTGRDAF